MKSKTISQKEADELEASIKGPMMAYKPWTEQEEIEMGQWVAADKAKHKAVQAKTTTALFYPSTPR